MAKIYVLVEGEQHPRPLEFEHLPRIGDKIVVPGLDGNNKLQLVTDVVHKPTMAGTGGLVTPTSHVYVSRS